MRTDYQPKPRVKPRPDHEKANGKVYSGKDKSMIALKKKGDIKKNTQKGQSKCKKIKKTKKRKKYLKVKRVKELEN